MNSFELIPDNEINDINGGFVITATMIIAGLEVFGGAFAIGYAVGQAFK